MMWLWHLANSPVLDQATAIGRQEI
jgi:hypothetical protein